ncbi:hypothetical protein [Salinirubrum litoreum]|uniref:Sulfatase n=1 Tax=Salinirubrum litoreum TaxID=1126234 RepID=A0ABD5RCZ5_9EURY|nr:hypothetical protein [Salinirubrum litoreum]
MPFQPDAFLDDLRDFSGWKSRAFFAVYYTYVGLWLTLSSRVRLGTHVFDEDWDLLVVLDTCRVDALRAVADEYDFLGDVATVWSLGSTSDEWMVQTFDRDHADLIARTAYVTANPYTDAVFHREHYPPTYRQPPATWPAWDVVSAGDFGLLDEVWRYGTDDSVKVTTPRVTTDRAIRAGRSGDYDRLVAHYMQPHIPYLGRTSEAAATPDDRLRTDGALLTALDTQPFDALRQGTADRAAVWDRYLDNLRLVLDSVELLLENVDAERVVITADHGEGFGEYGVYEHPIGCPAPTVKRVPWVVTTATDTGDHDPARHRDPAADTATGVEDDVADRLADLGYV